MPELPEVETVRRGLEKYVVGHTIEDVEILNPGIFEGDKKLIFGSRVVAIRRVGKGLIVDLDNTYSLAIHIKLTGQLIYRDEALKNTPVSKEKVGSIPNKFTHIIFHLDKGALLYYNDQRRFGWIKVLKTPEVFNLPFFKDMGPEPFKDLTLEKFQEIISKAPTKIKPLLMDQTKIGGIGNIYANDALWNAKINPKKSAKSLTATEAKDLFDSIIKVMKKSFEEGGASELSFVNILGQEGNYQMHSLVYGRKGQKCKNCGTLIQFEKIAGRGTYYCPTCQA